MLEKTTRIVSENLARAMDRRIFIKRTGQAAFLGLAALAAGQAMPTRAYADKAPPDINCAPPGPYCSIHGQPTDGCHGASCFQNMVSGIVYQCHVFYIYPAGCWTSSGTGGYWTCCDCTCDNGTSCGCAQFSTDPHPRPDTPGSGPTDA
jgi:hypothetical protein